MIETKIKEATQKEDLLPALFCSPDRSQVIVAIELPKDTDNFVGFVVHPKDQFGNYSATWKKSKYRRMPSGSEFILKFIQE